MQSANVLDRIRKMAEEVSAREGCTVYDIEFGGGGSAGRVLRIYLDKTDGNNVSIEDCANVSRGLNLMLDGAAEVGDDVVPGGEYSLEVSSPGIERVLRERWHYERAQGQKISLKTFAPLIDFNPERSDLSKARTLVGELSAVEDGGIRVQAAGDLGAVFIPFETITKAHTVFEFGEKGLPGKKKKKK